MVGEDSLGSRGPDRNIFGQDKENHESQREGIDMSSLLTHHGEPGSVALPRLATVLVFGDAPVR